MFLIYNNVDIRNQFVFILRDSEESSNSSEEDDSVDFWFKPSEK